jgi:betaine-aldehyde dehydrogenase
VQDRSQIFVGGKFIESDAKTRFDVISPNTEEVIGRVPDATPADVNRAVAAAREAFDKGPFPRWSPEERADGISRLSEALKKRSQDIANTISSENGCPISMSLGVQVLSSTMVLDLNAGFARSFPFDETRKGLMGNPVRVRRAPVGVSALIVPWNVPLYVIAMKLGPALAAGCTVIIKAAPETALDPYLLMEAAQEANLPPGVINFVCGAGPDVGEALVTELAYVPDAARDGFYLLDLQVPAFAADAAPSRPVIYPVTEQLR